MEKLKITIDELDDFIEEQRFSCLENAGVDNWSGYEDSLKEYKKAHGIDSYEELNWEQEFEALENGGVDNWSGYEYAFEGFNSWQDYLETEVEKGNSFMSLDDFRSQMY